MSLILPPQRFVLYFAQKISNYHQHNSFFLPQVDYWVKSVLLRAPKAPMMFVATHIDERGAVIIFLFFLFVLFLKEGFKYLIFVIFSLIGRKIRKLCRLSAKKILKNHKYRCNSRLQPPDWGKYIRTTTSFSFFSFFFHIFFLDSSFHSFHLGFGRNSSQTTLHARRSTFKIL